MTVYNTGKVRIGLLYCKPMPEVDVRLQRALLDPRTLTKPSWLERVWGWL